jgi:hypothetical protein
MPGMTRKIQRLARLDVSDLNRNGVNQVKPNGPVKLALLVAHDMDTGIVGEKPLSVVRVSGGDITVDFGRLENR